MTAAGTNTRWSVQNTLSCAGFAVRNLGVKTVRGTIPITHGWVDVDPNGRAVRVHAELDLAAIDTGNARRDRDLAKPHLLDLGRHPKLSFRGGPGEGVDGGWRVPGRIEAHGQAVDVVLDVRVTGNRIHASTQFDRADLGIRAPRVLIGRRIEVTVEAALEAS